MAKKAFANLKGNVANPPSPPPWFLLCPVPLQLLLRLTWVTLDDASRQA